MKKYSNNRKPVFFIYEEDRVVAEFYDDTAMAAFLYCYGNFENEKDKMWFDFLFPHDKYRIERIQ